MPTVIGSRGRIVHDSWQPDGAVRGAVVLLHGYGEHPGLYDPLARRLVADGLAVHAMDAVGHGRSDGERAIIASWGEFVDDVRRLVHLVRAQHRQVPLVVIGHSGGALAAMLLALRSPQILDALVLSGAAARPGMDRRGATCTAPGKSPRRSTFFGSSTAGPWPVRLWNSGPMSTTALWVSGGSPGWPPRSSPTPKRRTRPARPRSSVSSSRRSTQIHH